MLLSASLTTSMMLPTVTLPVSKMGSPLESIMASKVCTSPAMNSSMMKGPVWPSARNASRSASFSSL